MLTKLSTKRAWRVYHALHKAATVMQEALEYMPDVDERFRMMLRALAEREAADSVLALLVANATTRQKALSLEEK